jgi:hypothetical protein
VDRVLISRCSAGRERDDADITWPAKVLCAGFPAPHYNCVWRGRSLAYQYMQVGRHRLSFEQWILANMF